MSGMKDSMGRPLHDLRVSVTDRCNLRCNYCMPAKVFGPDYAFLDKGEILDFDEITRLCRLFSKCGVKKIRLTGGEPLLRIGLVELVERLAGISGIEDLALTTNGIHLARFAPSLKAAGLGRVTISLDALGERAARKLNINRESINRTLAGIDAAKVAGLGVKVNSVIVRGANDHEIIPLAKKFRGSGIVLRYIEYMDVGNHNGWREKDVVLGEDIISQLETDFNLTAVPPNYPGEVAKRYKYDRGEIGVISSVSKPFCNSCTRARLTADGKLVTCLFAKGGHDLRQPLRDGASDEEILGAIRGVWVNREDRYSDERKILLTKPVTQKKVEMSYLGG